MSYVPSRDNPALAGIGDATWDRLNQLVELADEASFPGQHEDACACTDPNCKILDRIRLGNGASSLEVLASAYARGLLQLDSHPGPFRLGRSHDDIVYETVDGEEHRNHPRVCVATSSAYARRIQFALNALNVGTASHGTLVGAVMEMTGCAPSDARKVVDMLRPDLGGAR